MEITIAAGKVEIIPIQTGTVSVKKKFRETSIKGFLSKPAFLLDKHFTEPMPIWVWVIKHPEGIYIIDTGENSNVNNTNYFDHAGFFTKWINQTQFKFDVSPEAEIGVQLKAAGITIDKIKKVILTHLHIDHFDGLKDFEGAEIVVNKLEWEKPSYTIPSLYPKWLSPTLVSVDNESGIGLTPLSLTATNDLFLMPTPGHTIGHCSVLLKGIDFNIIFAGDVVYHQGQLKAKQFAGVNQNFRLAEKTFTMLDNLMQKQPTIFLPSHDAGAANRLVNLEFY